jgi:hypothetical protein
MTGYVRLNETPRREPLVRLFIDDNDLVPSCLTMENFLKDTHRKDVCYAWREDGTVEIRASPLSLLHFPHGDSIAMLRNASFFKILKMLKILSAVPQQARPLFFVPPLMCCTTCTGREYMVGGKDGRVVRTKRPVYKLCYLDSGALTQQTRVMIGNLDSETLDTHKTRPRAVHNDSLSVHPLTPDTDEYNSVD